MNTLQIIERLCRIIDEAQEIITEQARLLDMHGIRTEGGRFEAKCGELVKRIQSEVGGS